jgi:hypothetical protein
VQEVIDESLADRCFTRYLIGTRDARVGAGVGEPRLPAMCRPGALLVSIP